MADSNFTKKLTCASIAGLTFALVSLPQVYLQTNNFTNTFDANNCPTPEGKFLHFALFFAIEFFIMKMMVQYDYMGMGGKSDALIAKYALCGAMLFFILASTDAYRMTAKLGLGLANEYGCPNVKGVVVHALVFVVLLLLKMQYLPRDH